MKRVESSPDDYIASQAPDIRAVLEELHTLIRAALPDRGYCMWEGVFWGGSEQRIIGYGNYSYQRSVDILPALKDMDSFVLQARELCYQQG